jgi:hypothetical protein
LYLLVAFRVDVGRPQRVSEFDWRLRKAHKLLDLAPYHALLREALAHDLAVGLGQETVPPRAEMVERRAECLQESPRLGRRLEPLGAGGHEADATLAAASTCQCRVAYGSRS